MKNVVAVIRPNKFFATKTLLAERGFMSMSVYNVLGHGPKRMGFSPAIGNAENAYEGASFYAKKWIEIYVRDEDKDRLIKTIFEANDTGHAGDGVVFVLPAEDAVRLRTGESGENALM
jgi:nitrogen regulatory protein PII 2